MIHSRGINTKAGHYFAIHNGDWSGPTLLVPPREGKSDLLKMYLALARCVRCFESLDSGGSFLAKELRGLLERARAALPEDEAEWLDKQDPYLDWPLDAFPVLLPDGLLPELVKGIAIDAIIGHLGNLDTAEVRL